MTRHRAAAGESNLRSRAGKVGSSTPRQVFIDGALSEYNNPRAVLNEGLDLAEPASRSTFCSASVREPRAPAARARTATAGSCFGSGKS